MRHLLPELLALSASSPFTENVFTHLHSVRTEIFTKLFPRCGIPDAYGSWAEFEKYVRFLYDTKSIDEHTQMWWSIRPHLAYPTVEIRICDAQPISARPGPRRPRLRPRGSNRPRAGRGRAAAPSPAPADRGELLAGDPLGPRRRLHRPRDGRARRQAEADRAADRVGAARRRGDRGGAVPGRAHGKRRRAPDRALRGATLEEIYAEQVRPRRPVGG